MTSADHAFETLAGTTLDLVLRHHPDYATSLGDHRFDDRLPEPGADARAAELRDLATIEQGLAAIDRAALSPQLDADAAVLENQLASLRFELEELREHEWNPMAANPGRALYMLLAREFAPLADRLRGVAGRLGRIPDSLAAARTELGSMPRVHIETALGQFAGTAALIGGELDRHLAEAPQSRAEIDAVRPAALAAIEEHQAWLKEKLEAGDFRDPRIGPDLFARKLSLSLDAQSDSAAILARAEADFERITEEITALATEILGRSEPDVVRTVLDQLAQDVPDDETIIGLCADAFAAQTAFVREQDLVTVHDDPTKVIVMPEIDRGVAVAYCDPPGPLETESLPTFVAVSPTPADWPPERVASFYREYNKHLVHDLMAHEAMPGHVLQLQHSARFAGATPLRKAFWSGSFVEGWAVYAEQLMAESGYPGNGDSRAVRMQQLKMQLRMSANAIIDARVHAHGMPEEDAMRLMVERGHQEEGEAVGKWRRALLTSAQLSTYYVGYTEVGDLVADLRAVHPEWSTRQVHDTVLGNGSPAARHLRKLVLAS